MRNEKAAHFAGDAGRRVSGRRLILLLMLAGMSALLAAGCAEYARTIPPRAGDAVGGGAFVVRVRDMEPGGREQAVRSELLSGNLPGFLRSFVAVQVCNGGHKARYYVMPDYLSIGSDEDFVRMPMRPATAREIARRFDCSLPTRKMVDDIYRAAAVKLEPSPFDPRRYDITSVEVFHKSHLRIEQQRKGRPAGLLVAGIKKDIVMTPLLEGDDEHVAIYGWHRPDGRPIQPLYVKHLAHWVDYSHGVRLVSNRMYVDGRRTTVREVLADPQRCGLLSDEGPHRTDPAEVAPSRGGTRMLAPLR